MRRLTFLLVPLLCVASRAQPIEARDPAVGGYFFFAALEQRCPTPDAVRAATLQRFKEHFVGNVHEIAKSYGPSGSSALQALAELERNGPPDSELARFDSLFQGASPTEIASLCSDAANLMGQRMALESKLKSSSASAVGATPR